ncbi:MurR/RpiR family transcriptional regulator [Neorhizobium galegae]|uniref:MurR/RpiR family transcriptional regulator n=1 Tax=Neorhizobium galegae TaxID=399 RepID=UPI00155E4E8D|nr:MurR/RpiR family transcriptional regulator [Neorhizobium galegae]
MTARTAGCMVTGSEIICTFTARDGLNGIDDLTEATTADRISALLSSLTTSEKRAARVLLARYPTVGLESVTSFAAQAHVSAPTILRFIAKLGFDGYPAFRAALRHEVDEGRRGPLSIPRPEADTLIGRYATELSEIVSTTLAELNPSDLERVVECLADERRSIFVLGGAFTNSVATHLSFHLRKIRKKVFDLAQSPQQRADVLADISKKDVLVVFDIRRYQADAVVTSQIAAQRGATVVLFTDYWMSTASEFSDFVFRAKVDCSSPWDSLVGLTAIVETIALELDRTRWSLVRPRLEAIEQIRSRLGQCTSSDDVR